jgi:hypothetical protein
MLLFSVENIVASRLVAGQLVVNEFESPIQTPSVVTLRHVIIFWPHENEITDPQKTAY